MADEALAETQPVEEPAPAIEAIPDEPVSAPAEPDGEPGGASPEDIRARKEYRTRKTVEKELQSERIERIRLEERLRLLEQQAPQPQAPAKPRVYTLEEVQGALDEGKITHTQASAYLARVEAERVHDEREARAAAQLKVQAPIERATNEVNEYMALLPWTNDRASEEFKEVANTYYSLVNQYGMPDNIVTQRIAIERVAGSLDRIKARMASDRDTRRARIDDAHSETPAGGPAPSSANNLSKAPAHMVAVWNKTGLSEEKRKQEFAIWKQSRK